MIIEFHRGHVTLDVNGKRITIEGEAYLSGFGSPNFVAYKNSIGRWDFPERGLLTPVEIDFVLETLRKDFHERNMSLEIE